MIFLELTTIMETISLSTTIECFLFLQCFNIQATYEYFHHEFRETVISRGYYNYFHAGEKKKKIEYKHDVIS